jgi:hypothetical protein
MIDKIYIEEAIRIRKEYLKNLLNVTKFEKVYQEIFDKLEKEKEKVSNFDADEFSQTEMECLDESVKSYLTKSFDFLTNHSHDEAWMDATYTMDELKIAKAGGADRKMLNYIKEHNELVNARFY